MGSDSEKAKASKVLDEFGVTFCSELNISPEGMTPGHLFKTLVFSLLASARISHNAAMRATRGLFDAGWTTAKKMAAATWEERVKVLNTHGYARYDESTSRYLGYTCDLMIEKYGGDLNRLREAAGRDPERERKLLLEFKGIGNVGVNIFFREVQLSWDELYPFADDLALKAAAALGMGASAGELCKLVSRADFPRLVAGLVRMKLGKKI